MARPNKIWYRKDRKTYYVTIAGKTYKLGKDKKKSEKRFHELMAGIVEEITSSDRKTAAELMDAFLSWTGENRAPRTFDWYKAHLQAFLDSLSNQLIDAAHVRPHHVESWVTGKGWSPSYKRGAMGAVKRAFKWAATQGYIESSPIAGLERPTATRREDYPTEAEFEAIVAAATEPFASLLQSAYETGARPQELRALQPRHYMNGRIEFPVKESKGKKYARVIYLNDKAKAIVEDRLDGEFIFVNRDGNQWTAYAINCRMRRIGEKTKKHYPMYSIRHLTATRWLEAGLDHITVAKLLGHRDSSMIARVYGHIGQKNDFLLDQLRKVS